MEERDDDSGRRFKRTGAHKQRNPVTSRLPSWMHNDRDTVDEYFHEFWQRYLAQGLEKYGKDFVPQLLNDLGLAEHNQNNLLTRVLYDLAIDPQYSIAVRNKPQDVAGRNLLLLLSHVLFPYDAQENRRSSYRVKAKIGDGKPDDSSTELLTKQEYLDAQAKIQGLEGKYSAKELGLTVKEKTHYEKEAPSFVDIPPFPLKPYGKAEQENSGEFEQLLTSRITELLGNGKSDAAKRAKTADVVTLLAKRAGVHPWTLQGHASLASSHDPDHIAHFLTRTLYPNNAEEVEEESEATTSPEADRFYKAAKNFLSQSRTLNISSGQKSIPQDAAGMLTALMTYHDVTPEMLSARMQSIEQPLSVTQIGNLLARRSLPDKKTYAKLGAEFGLTGDLAGLWQDAFSRSEITGHPIAEAGKLYALERRKARCIASQKQSIASDVVEQQIPKRIAEALEPLLSKKDADGKVLYGAQGQTLRLSQQEALEATIETLKNNTTHGHILLPGGVGKTRYKVAMAEAAAKAGFKTLWIVPSVLAAEGAVKEIRKTAPNLKIGIKFDNQDDLSGDVHIMTYQSLINEFYHSILAEIKGEKHEFSLANYRLILGDEGHRYLTELSDTLFRQSNAVTIAVTATPRYEAGKDVSNQFGDAIYAATLPEVIARHECMPLTYKFIQTKVDVNYDAIRDALLRDEHSREVSAAVNKPAWNRIFADVYAKDTHQASGTPVFGENAMIFCADIDHAKDMAKTFNDSLAPLLKQEHFRKILQEKGKDPSKIKQIAAPMWGGMPKELRKSRLRQYERGEILVLTSAELLVASVDSPATSVVMNATPTLSPVKAGQRGYRGSRMHEGKPFWMVYDALPERWQDQDTQPILFSEIAHDVIRLHMVREHLRNYAKRKLERKGHAISDAATISTNGQDDYNLIWNAQDVLEITDVSHRAHMAGYGNHPGRHSGFIGAGIAAKILGSEGYVSTENQLSDTLEQTMMQLAAKLPEGWPKGVPYALEAGDGMIVPLVLVTKPRSGDITVYGEEHALIDYLKTLPQLQQRQQGYVSPTGVQELFEAQGIHISHKFVRPEMMELIDAAPPGTDISKPFSVTTPHGAVSVFLADNNKKKEGVTQQTPYVQADQFVPYLTAKLDLKPNSVPEGFITAGAAMRILKDMGIPASSNVIFDEMSRLLQQVPEDSRNGVQTVKTDSGDVDVYATTKQHKRKSIEQPYARQTQIIPYLQKAMHLAKDHDGFIPAHAAESALREQGYGAAEIKIRGVMDDLLKQVPETHTKTEPYPVPTEVGEVRIYTARSPKGETPYADKEQLLKLLHARLPLKKKAPSGFVAVGNLKAKLRELGYGIGSDTVIKSALETLSKTKPTKKEGDIQLHKTPAGNVTLHTEGKPDSPVYTKEAKAIPFLVHELYLHKSPDNYLPASRCLNQLREQGHTVYWEQVKAAYEEIEARARECDVRSTPIDIATPHDKISVYLGSSTAGIKPFVRDDDACRYVLESIGKGGANDKVSEVSIAPAKFKGTGGYGDRTKAALANRSERGL